MDAISATKEGKELARRANTKKGIAGKRYKELDRVEERFARAYSQYIAVRSGHPELLAALRHERAVRPGDVAAGSPFGEVRQWSDESFEPVARAFDALFAQKGWSR